MKVRALNRGFYGRMYDVGQVFDLVDDEHLGSWMEPVDADDRKRLAGKLAGYARNRNVATPGVPETTGPGFGMRDPVMPQPNAKSKG